MKKLLVLSITFITLFLSLNFKVSADDVYISPAPGSGWAMETKYDSEGTEVILMTYRTQPFPAETTAFAISFTMTEYFDSLLWSYYESDLVTPHQLCMRVYDPDTSTELVRYDYNVVSDWSLASIATHPWGYLDPSAETWGIGFLNMDDTGEDWNLPDYPNAYFEVQLVLSPAYITAWWHAPYLNPLLDYIIQDPNGGTDQDTYSYIVVPSTAFVYEIQFYVSGELINSQYYQDGFQDVDIDLVPTVQAPISQTGVYTFVGWRYANFKAFDETDIDVSQANDMIIKLYPRWSVEPITVISNEDIDPTSGAVPAFIVTIMTSFHMANSVGYMFIFIIVNTLAYVGILLSKKPILKGSIAFLLFIWFIIATWWNIVPYAVTAIAGLLELTVIIMGFGVAETGGETDV